MMKNLGLCHCRQRTAAGATPVLAVIAAGMVTSASAQSLVDPVAVSLWRTYMDRPLTTAPRLVVKTNRTILQTSASSAKFQNGNYSFTLSDGGVPGVDGDVDGYTDELELDSDFSIIKTDDPIVVYDSPASPNNPDSIPTDKDGKAEKRNAFAISLANGSIIGLADTTGVSQDAKASLVNPFSGNAVVINDAPNSDFERPIPLADYSTSFFFTDPTTGFSSFYPLSLYHLFQNYPNPGDGAAFERTLVPGSYRVIFPVVANPNIKGGSWASHQLVPNGALTLGLKKPSWLVRSIYNAERFDKQPVECKWVNGRIVFDPNLPTTITWDDLVRNGLAAPSTDRIALWFTNRSGRQVWPFFLDDGSAASLFVSLTQPSVTLQPGPLYGEIEVGKPASELAFNGFLVMQYSRNFSRVASGDVSTVTLRVPIRMACTYASWRYEVFSVTDRLNDAISGPSADPDKDGVTNEDEFEYGLDPNNPDTDGDGIGDSEEVEDIIANKDTDRDGVSDSDEKALIFTDPNKQSFSVAGSSTPVQFSSSKVRGSYQGIVIDPKTSVTFKQSVWISPDGTFTCRLQGVSKSTSFKGKFASDGTFRGPLTNSVGLTSVRMAVAKESQNGRYVVRGQFEDSAGGKQYFVLHRKANTAPLNSRITFEASRSGPASGPAGSAISTGRISGNGQATFNILLPDGNPVSFTGPVLDGNLIAVHVKTATTPATSMLGMLKIRTINNRSDFDGTVRLFSDSGYDQTRALTGSVYKRPAKGELPLEVLQSGPGQTTFSWNGGSFAGTRSPGNWGKNDKITIPATTSGSGNGTFNRNTGLLTVAYSRPGETANSKAVVIQSRNTCKGFYTTGTSVGGFSAAPTK